MEKTASQLIERGSIKVSDDVSFRTKAECASLFGKNYSNILTGGVPHPKDKELNGIILWKEGENDGWENSYTENRKGEIVGFTELKKVGHKEWVEEWAKEELKEDRRIIFYKKEGEGYRFRGIFLIDFERSIKEGEKFYQRVSTKANTYPPGNKKPLKDLKEIVKRGLIKEKEKIYFHYKDHEYSGRVTSEGKVEIHIGTMTLNRASWELMFLTPGCQRNTKRVNAYDWWKTWNGTPLNDLRKL
jgi:hypothetical protein